MCMFIRGMWPNIAAAVPVSYLPCAASREPMIWMIFLRPISTTGSLQLAKICRATTREAQSSLECSAVSQAERISGLLRATRLRSLDDLGVRSEGFEGGSLGGFFRATREQDRRTTSRATRIPSKMFGSISWKCRDQR